MNSDTNKIRTLSNDAQWLWDSITQRGLLLSKYRDQWATQWPLEEEDYSPPLVGLRPEIAEELIAVGLIEPDYTIVYYHAKLEQP